MPGDAVSRTQTVIPSRSQTNRLFNEYAAAKTTNKRRNLIGVTVRILVLPLKITRKLDKIYEKPYFSDRTRQRTPASLGRRDTSKGTLMIPLLSTWRHFPDLGIRGGSPGQRTPVSPRRQTSGLRETAGPETPRERPQLQDGSREKGFQKSVRGLPSVLG